MKTVELSERNRHDHGGDNIQRHPLEIFFAADLIRDCFGVSAGTDLPERPQGHSRFDPAKRSDWLVGLSHNRGALR